MSTFKRNQTGKSLSTELIHDPVVDASGFKCLAPPQYRGSSTFFESSAHQQAQVDTLGIDYSYGLHGNPTQYTLAKRLALIEQARHCLIAPSGLNAITLVAHACLSSGDHWLIPSNVYGPVVDLAIDMASCMNVQYDLYDPLNLHTLRQAIKANTKLVWVEAPGSMTFETPDIEQLVSMTKSSQPGALLAIDNTYSAGLSFKPFSWGFDFSIQALTKYQCGHADVLLGAVLSDNTKAFAKVERKNRITGAGVSPADCSLVLRGLLTLTARYEKQAKNALEVASWLEQQPQVAVVLHPEFEYTPGQAHFKRYFSQACSLFSIAFTDEITSKQAEQFVDSLELFNIAYSWGGPESLALKLNLPTSRLKHLQYQLTEQGYKGHIGPLVRLAIGLEAPQDLITDLNQALTQST